MTPVAELARIGTRKTAHEIRLEWKRNRRRDANPTRDVREGAVERVPLET